MKLFLLVFTTSIAPLAAAKSWRSGPAQVALVELYTSEGCSSCPPADVWLSKQKKRSDLWSKVIPLGFHVDYWNYLGWKDPFSSDRYSLRQRLLARTWPKPSVYTPGVMVNGAEWKKWRAGGDPPPGKRKAGQLVVEATKQKFTVTYKDGNPKAAMAYGVRLLFDQKTKVKNGENAGETLHHDFVVCAFANAKLVAGKATLAVPACSQPGKQGVAFWVAGDDIVPLQATGGWL